MIKEKMTVGPKGQVVIPNALRKALKIGPGTKVTVKLEDDKVIIEKHAANSVAVFGMISKKGKSVRKISAHQYEDEILERNNL